MRFWSQASVCCSPSFSRFFFQYIRTLIYVSLIYVRFSRDRRSRTRAARGFVMILIYNFSPLFDLRLLTPIKYHLAERARAS